MIADALGAVEDIAEPSTGAASSSTEAVAPLMPTAAEVDAASELNYGDIVCPLPPWSAYPRIARITNWPAHVEPAKRSVSVQCYVHGCRPPAKGRLKVSDKFSKMWARSGDCLPRFASSEEQRVARERHDALWRELWARHDSIS